MINQKHWHTTSEYAHIAKRHCAVTQVMNLYEIIPNEAINFSLAHKYIKNGPVLFLKRKLKKSPFNLNVARIKNIKDVHQAINQNEIVVLLQRRSLFNWHWVIALGIKDEDTLLIVDGWHKKIQPFNIKDKIKICYPFSFKVY